MCNEVKLTETARRAGKERQTDRETDGYFVSPPARLVAGATGPAWPGSMLEYEKKKNKEKTRKERKAPQSMRPFLF